MAGRLADVWPDTVVLEGPLRQALSTGWEQCTGLVCFLAAGATVRLVAPLLTGKDRDPGVVCVDEAGRFAIALLGGHGGGANALATRVARTLGAAPVITTATDAVATTALDSLTSCGFRLEGALATVGAALLDGSPVDLVADPDLPPGGRPSSWPLPPLAATKTTRRTPGRAALLVTDRARPAAGDADDGAVTVWVRPPSLVVGVGASRGAEAAEAAELLTAALAAAGSSALAIRVLATADIKREEAALQALAAQLGVGLECWTAAELAQVSVPHPSEAVRAAVGTPSVAEAAALLSAGPGAVLVAPKHIGRTVTLAVARQRPRGRLALVGIGPGARDLMAPRAATEIARASIIVGLDQYIEQVRDLIRPGTQVVASGLGSEQARARSAVDAAVSGRAVALIGSGDAGVYAMASPALELPHSGEVDVVGVPGITAALAAAALLGAPLGHDAATVSLSDLHTPWAVIQRRVAAAAEGDFTVTFYNPRSSGRPWQLGAALDLLRRHRSPATPVGIVCNASRPGQQVSVTTLAEVDVEQVEMHCVVVVGSSATRTVAGRLVTPRGYRWAP